MILIGVAFGIAVAAGRLPENVVAGMQPTTAGSFALMVLLLVMAALFARFWPARRASRIDPVFALRQD